MAAAATTSSMKTAIVPLLPTLPTRVSLSTETQRQLTEHRAPRRKLLCEPDSSFYSASTIVAVKIPLRAAAVAALSGGVFRKSDLRQNDIFSQIWRQDETDPVCSPSRGAGAHRPYMCNTLYIHCIYVNTLCLRSGSKYIEIHRPNTLSKKCVSRVQSVQYTLRYR